MLIDVIYDNRVKLFWTGEKPPDQLIQDLSLIKNSNNSVTSDCMTVLNCHHVQFDQQNSNAMIKNVERVLPHELLRGETAAFEDLRFAVQRCLSRIIEMSGQKYILSPSITVH
jgi:predicted ATPase